VAANATTEEDEPAAASAEPARVVVVTSGKGGVGKTTSTANLGMSIARLGYRVALIDADIGLRNLDLLLGLENRVMFTAMEVLDGECRLEQARHLYAPAPLQAALAVVALLRLRLGA
jgi:septum site-determining protein MinD